MTSEDGGGGAGEGRSPGSAGAAGSGGESGTTSFVPDDDRLAAIFRTARTVAVVGLSDDPARPSHGVAAYLQAQGYRIVPVNPRLTEVLGERAQPDLDSVPEAVDVVDVFRRPEEVGPVAAAAVRRGARVLWLQEGVVNVEAAATARAAGLTVVMDRCMLKEHRRLRAAGRLG